MKIATSISVATLSIAVVLIGLNLRSFWKGKKDPKILFPGSGGMVFGSTLAACVGGALGTSAGAVAGAGNGVSGIVPWATGAGDRGVAVGHATGLTVEGGVIAVLVAVLGFLAAREGAKTSKKRVLGGAFCGIVLTYTAGIAALVAAYLIPAYNEVGRQLVAAVEGAL